MVVKKESTVEKNFDLVIVGAGVAGLAGGMYGARLGLKTLVLGASHGSELPIGGVITTTHLVENYPGFVSLSGQELADKLREHAQSYELVTLKNEKVTDVKKNSYGFEISTAKNNYSGKTILIATGTKWKKLPDSVKGWKEFENKGVAYCALCDAPLFKNKTVAVIGGSDTAGKDALVLAEHAKKVYIIYRGEKIRPEPINLKRIQEHKKIEVITQTNVVEVKGDRIVRTVVLDNNFNGKKELALDGVFVAIGHEALSELAKKLSVKLNEKGEIILNHKTSETNVAGVFAAGDVADKEFKQAITGVAEACTAAYSAFEYLKKNRA